MVVTFRLLYTGFLPFDDGSGKRPPNPSGDGAREMAKRAKVEAVGPKGVTLVANITTRIFDVLWSVPDQGSVGPAQSGAADELVKAIDEDVPDIVIATGMGDDHFRVEQVAEDFDGKNSRWLVSPTVNLDNNGRFVLGGREYPTEPLLLDTTLPFKKIQDAWAKASVKTRESRNAGNFICEDVFYRLMRTAADKNRLAKGLRILRAGFCHVPTTASAGTVADTMEIAIRETMLDIPEKDYPVTPAEFLSPEDMCNPNADPWR